MIISDFKHGNMGTVVYLQKPCKRVVNIDIDHYPFLYKKSFFLSIPYVFFRIIYYNRNNKEYYTNTLFRPPFPNIFYNCNCCCPMKTVFFSSLEAMIKAQISSFWAAEFSYVKGHNYDPNGLYCPHFKLNLEGEVVAKSINSDQYPEDALLVDHRKWEQKTKENPEWIPGQDEMLQCYPMDNIFLSNTNAHVQMRYPAKYGCKEMIR